VTKLLNKLKQYFCSLGMLTVVTVGGPGMDIMSDQGHSSEAIYAKDGNDVLVFTPSLSKNDSVFFDGGKGFDTLWLRIPKKDFDNPHFQADLIHAYTFISINLDPDSDSAIGALYQFDGFHASFRNMENIEVELISTRPQDTVYNTSPARNIPLKNSDDNNVI